LNIKIITNQEYLFSKVVPLFSSDASKVINIQQFLYLKMA